MTTTTIASISADANTLFTSLAGDLVVDLDLVPLVLDTDFTIPPLPDLPVVVPLTLADLTTQVVDGTGVFDGLMKTVTAHLESQFSRNRITGSDYAKVYLGALQTTLSSALEFLLRRDRAALENAQLVEAVKLSQAQTIAAQAQIELVRAQIQQAQYATVELRLRAYTARNQYASSKMDLVLGYNNVLEQQNKAELVNEQIESQRGQTLLTRRDGASITGVIGGQVSLALAQVNMTNEQQDAARASTKDTLRDGSAVGGITAVDKTIKLAQLDLTNEQVDTQRAQTKTTLKAGGAITGIAAKDLALKDAQSKLVLEQYETQRAQTRPKLSDNTTVAGMVGAQTALYQQQITSYQRDAESKALKMILDTWVARKTIDDGVAVPVQIDTAAIGTMMTAYRSNLSL